MRSIEVYRSEREDALGKGGRDLATHLDRPRSQGVEPDGRLPPRDDDLGEVHEDAARAAQRVGSLVDRLVVHLEGGRRNGRRNLVRAERGDEARGLVGEAQGVREEGGGELSVAAGRGESARLRRQRKRGRRTDDAQGRQNGALVALLERVR